MEVADFANDGPPSSSLGSLEGYFDQESLGAPIDSYRASTSAILAYGTTERLNESAFLGRLLVLGLVSAVEGYVRGVLSACMEVCPIAQATASSQRIDLGGLLWHGKSGFSRSAFEHSSFSSREELSKAYKNFIGFKLDDTVFKSILDEYETICHLRHGIVHSDGFLPGRNAVFLDIPRFSKPARIKISFAQLQEIGSVVNTLVFTLNRELFSEMCKRWAIDWRRRADWDISNEMPLFGKLWAAFHSASELPTRQGRSKITRSKCILQIKSTYNI